MSSPDGNELTKAVTLTWCQLNAIATSLSATCVVLEKTAGKYTRGYQQLSDTLTLITAAADELAAEGGRAETT